MKKWADKIQDILNQKAAIEFGAIPPTLIERTIDKRIECDAAAKVVRSNYTDNVTINEEDAVIRFYEKARKLD